jgi:hypothetical protein
VIVVGLLAFGLLAWAITKRNRSHGLPGWVMRHSLAQKAFEELRRFEGGAVDLLHLRTLAIATALGTVYLVIAGSGLYLITSALGLHVAYSAALAVFFFSLAFSLIFPLPVDIGVLEVSATGAWLAVGLDRATAVSVVLIYRILSLASALLISLIGIIVLHDDLRLVLRGGERNVSAPARPPVPQRSTTQRSTTQRSTTQRSASKRPHPPTGDGSATDAPSGQARSTRPEGASGGPGSVDQQRPQPPGGGAKPLTSSRGAPQRLNSERRMSGDGGTTASLGVALSSQSTTSSLSSDTAAQEEQRERTPC